MKVVCAIVPLLVFQFHDSSLSVGYTFFDSLVYVTVSFDVCKNLLAGNVVIMYLQEWQCSNN